MKEYNIVIIGVGGQGIFIVVNFFGWVVLRVGYKVCVGEVYGMSQCFGSVIVYVCFGEDVYGVMVFEGKVDVIFFFEFVEVFCYINYFKKGGFVFINVRFILFVQVLMGFVIYLMFDEMKKIVEEDFGGKFMVFDVEKLVMEVGNIVIINVVFIGVFSQIFGFLFLEEQIKEVIRISVLLKMIDVNMRVFEFGVKVVKEMLGF